MRPIRDNLLIEPIKRDEKRGELVLVGALDNTLRGSVLQVGKDVKEISEGETILYHEGQGLKLVEDGKDYVLLREAEIALVL
jgi:co-chaperonin GroES (HSP10)